MANVQLQYPKELHPRKRKVRQLQLNLSHDFAKAS